MSAACRYDESYAEEVTLRDGTRVRFRLVRPADKGLFVEAFRRLSPESRYRRFLAAKKDLTPAELRYLTETDAKGHLAIVALEGPPGRERGVGVARFVRLGGEPDAVEAAVAVTDDFHGRGLGTRLAERLLRAARERGVRRVLCEVLAENEPVRKLIRRLAPRAVERPDGRTVEVEILLGRGASGPFRGLVSLAARGALALRRTLKELGSRPRS